MNDFNINDLLSDMESDRIERTISTTDTNKFAEAICAFSNDLPNYKKAGYLLIGVDDKTGIPCGLTVTDAILKNLAAIRNNGNILPQPAMTVEKFTLPEGDVAVVKVMPSLQPPVRFRGKIWVRIGPSKATANETDERILTEKRTSNAKTFDAMAVIGTEIKEINLSVFKEKYLPTAIDPEIIEQNGREIKIQLASLRLYDLKYDCPTYAGILLLADNPEYYLAGAYIQYVKFDGLDKASPIINQKKFTGNLVEVTKKIVDFIEFNIVQDKIVRSNDSFKHREESNYPKLVLRELLMNAIMHRDYESNAPIHFYEYKDRIEIQNAGFLYGGANVANFPNVNDYRNPIVGEILKNLDYVEKFSVGINTVKRALAENGNPEPVFDLSLETSFLTKVFAKI